MIKKYDNVRIHLLRVHKRISCVYTRDLLCMHNILVHALRWAGPRPWTAPLLGPWPLGSLAQSMHKSVVHAQDISCVYTRDSFVYTQLCETMRNYAELLYLLLYFYYCMFTIVFLLLYFYYCIFLFYLVRPRTLGPPRVSEKHRGD